MRNAMNILSVFFATHDDEVAQFFTALRIGGKLRADDLLDVRIVKHRSTVAFHDKHLEEIIWNRSALHRQ